MSLFAAIMAAQGGKLLAQLAKPQDVDQSTLERTLEAVLPFLSQSLKSKTSNVAGLRELAEFAKSQNFAQLIDQPGQTETGAVEQLGGAAVKMLLGSDAKTARLLSLLQTSTGIGQAALQFSVPAVSSLVMGVIAKELANPSTQARLNETLGGGSFVGRLFGTFSGIFGGGGGGHAGKRVFGKMLEAGVDHDEAWVRDAFDTSDSA